MSKQISNNSEHVAGDSPPESRQRFQRTSLVDWLNPTKIHEGESGDEYCQIEYWTSASFFHVDDRPINAVTGLVSSLVDVVASVLREHGPSTFGTAEVIRFQYRLKDMWPNWESFLSSHHSNPTRFPNYKAFCELAATYDRLALASAFNDVVQTRLKYIKNDAWKYAVADVVKASGSWRVGWRKLDDEEAVKGAEFFELNQGKWYSWAAPFTEPPRKLNRDSKIIIAQLADLSSSQRKEVFSDLLTHTDFGAELRDLVYQDLGHIAGKKRAETLTSEHQSAAAKTQSERLTPEERSERARRAVQARWDKKRNAGP